MDESGHEPQLRAVHADGATAKEAKMGGEARPSGSGVGLMHRLRAVRVSGLSTPSLSNPKSNTGHWLDALLTACFDTVSQRLFQLA